MVIAANQTDPQSPGRQDVLSLVWLTRQTHSPLGDKTWNGQMCRWLSTQTQSPLGDSEFGMLVKLTRQIHNPLRKRTCDNQLIRQTHNPLGEEPLCVSLGVNVTLVMLINVERPMQLWVGPTWTGILDWTNGGKQAESEIACIVYSCTVAPCDQLLKAPASPTLLS